MKKFLGLLLVVMIVLTLQGCSKDKFKYSHTVKVQEGDQIVKDYEVYISTNKTFAEYWVETDIDRYELAWSGDYAHYKLVVDGRTVDFIEGLRNRTFDINDIGRSGIPVKIVQEYPYSVNEYEQIKKIIEVVPSGRDTTYTLLVKFVPTEYVASWSVSYEEGLRTYTYYSSNMEHVIAIGNERYNIPTIFEMLNSGEISIDTLVNLGLPMEFIEILIEPVPET